jgi:hypothetical protein
MISRIFAFRVPALSLLVLMTMMPAASLRSASPNDEQRGRAASGDSSTQQAAADFKGTWSGTFFSKHANVPAFTMTVVINPDPQGRLIGSASLNSDCLKDLSLEVTVVGSRVLLAGSDEDGNSITVRGTVDNTGTMVKAKYILNGSATGRCEADTGTGNLAKR